MPTWCCSTPIRSSPSITCTASAVSSEAGAISARRNSTRSRRRSPRPDRPGDRRLSRGWLAAGRQGGSGGREAAMARSIERDEVQQLMGQGAQIVDVLPAREYAEDHLPGAVNLPLRKIEAEALRVLDPSRPVVVYCADSA